MTGIRLIGIDIDGTLLDSYGCASTSALAEMRRLHGTGVQLVLVTGRRFVSAWPIARYLQLPVLIAGHNGASLRRMDGSALYSMALAESLTREVCAFALERGGFPWVYVETDDSGESQIYCQDPAAVSSGAADYCRAYFEAAQEYIRVLGDLSAEFQGGSVEVMVTVEAERAEKLSKAFRRRFGDAVSVILEVSGRFGHVEAAHPSVSKALPLKTLAEKGGFGPENIMAVGDNFNDLEMLEYAGHPVVMGNAHRELRRLGYRVAPTNDEDGLAQILSEVSSEA